jgi:UDP-2-acetamido-2,6-beta-L-arabino-hexul-4-ose reductase
MELRSVSDQRGCLLKVLMRHHLGEVDREFGEIYISSAVPGAFKGGHYHMQTTEWFLVVQGMGNFWCRSKDSDWKAKPVNASTPSVIEVRPEIWHVFRNEGARDLLVLAYSNRPYDSEDPDTFRISLPWV